MKEYVFDELGYFSKQTCEKIKKAMDGRTFMNFKVEYSNCAGNYTFNTYNASESVHNAL